MYIKLYKRIVDIIISLILLILTFPILVFVGTMLGLSLNSFNIFFFQDRVGINDIVFKIIKFRTMSDRVNSSGVLLPDAVRLTKIGKFLRSASLDELPQLINVLIGDMSLVGPRPLLIKYLPLYSKEQKRRHEVRPGITGWAQVNGRNAISWQQKFEYDIWYVENICFKTDIKILIMTIKKVLLRKDINSETSTTMEAFKGNKE